MSTLLELALFAILAGVTSVGAVVAVRQAPLVRGWNERGVKPWACDLCMSFWMTLLIVGIGIFSANHPPLEWLGAWMPAFTISYTWLTRVTPAPPDAAVGFPDEPPSPVLTPDEWDESE